MALARCIIYLHGSIVAENLQRQSLVHRDEAPLRIIQSTDQSVITGLKQIDATLRADLSISHVELLLPKAGASTSTATAKTCLSLQNTVYAAILVAIFTRPLLQEINFNTVAQTPHRNIRIRGSQHLCRWPANWQPQQLKQHEQTDYEPA